MYPDSYDIGKVVSALTKQASDCVSQSVEAVVHAGPHAVEEVAISKSLSILSEWFTGFADAIAYEYERLYDREIYSENPTFLEEFVAYCWSLIYWRTMYTRARYDNPKLRVEIYDANGRVDVVKLYGNLRQSPTIWIPGLIYVLIHKIGYVKDEELNVTYVPAWGDDNWKPWSLERLEQWSKRWLAPVAGKKLFFGRRLDKEPVGCPDTMMAFLAIDASEEEVHKFQRPASNRRATVMSRRRNLPMVAGLFASCLGLTLCRTLTEPLAHYNPARTYAFTLVNLIWEGVDV
jgi:hypothetical protein